SEDTPEWTHSQTPERTSKAAGPVPVLVKLADVQTTTVSWLWPRRIPFGKLTLIDGDPGLGKSTVALTIAASLTRGVPPPDGKALGCVVILSAEDGLADTIRPRLEAANADLARVHALTAVKDPRGEEVFPNITANLSEIEDAIGSTRARLVVIDPLMAYLGAE